jgi:hypothetical protein
MSFGPSQSLGPPVHEEAFEVVPISDSEPSFRRIASHGYRSFVNRSHVFRELSSAELRPEARLTLDQPEPVVFSLSSEEPVRPARRTRKTM